MNTKEYQKQYHEKWYAIPENAEAKKKNAKFHRAKSLQRNLDFVREYKSNHPCSKCAEYHPEYIEKNPVCLHFHHCNGDKKENIATLARSLVGLKRLKEEMDKCIVVCGNCHALIHEEIRQSGR